MAGLVRDAVGATGIVIEHPSYLDLYGQELGLVDVRLALIGNHVRIDVWDADPTPRWPREPASELAGADPSVVVAKRPVLELLLPADRRKGDARRTGDATRRFVGRHPGARLASASGNPAPHGAAAASSPDQRGDRPDPAPAASGWPSSTANRSVRW